MPTTANPSQHVLSLIIALIISALGLVVLSFDAAGEVPSDATTGKLPKPTEQNLATAKKSVDSLFAEEYARANERYAKATLARKLLETGKQTSDDPAGAYWLLLESQRMGIQGGQLKTVFEAIDALAHRFEGISVSAYRAAACEQMSTVDFPLPTLKEIADCVVENVEAAIAADEFAVATQFIKAGTAAASRINNLKLSRQLEEFSQDSQNLKEQYNQYASAIELLKVNSRDPAANRTVGMYLALRHNDWIRAEEHLALSDARELRGIVAREFANSTDIADQVALADDWWDVAESLTGAEEVQAKVRAVSWYRKSLGQLTGLSRRRIEERIAGVSESALSRMPKPNPSLRNENDDRPLPAASATRLAPLTNSVGMKFVPIPAGEFLMGSSPSDRSARKDEFPQHRVRITRPFLLASFEVTNSQFFAVMGGASPRRGAENHSVGNVSWNDAVRFCQNLSELPDERSKGRTYRLPTEAEWEYACRAGTTTLYYFGNDVELLRDHAWTDGTRIDVGTKKPNPWGLYDIQGNGSEWCSDWYSETWYSASPANDPAGPDKGVFRVHRGSTWGDAEILNRSATRRQFYPDRRYPTLAIRVVCEAK